MTHLLKELRRLPTRFIGSDLENFKDAIIKIYAKTDLVVYVSDCQVFLLFTMLFLRGSSMLYFTHLSKDVRRKYNYRHLPITNNNYHIYKNKVWSLSSKSTLFYLGSMLFIISCFKNKKQQKYSLNHCVGKEQAQILKLERKNNN